MNSYSQSARARAARSRHVGERGEDYAALLYERRGATIIARNVRFACGEIDIVAKLPDGTIAFVEVKTRTTNSFGHGAESVDAFKLARLRRAACRWLQDRPHMSVRFDVVEIGPSGIQLYEEVDHCAR